MKRFIITFVVFLPFIVFAQNDKQPVSSNYPQDYFRNPLNIPIFLAGNFGECRPGHFHSGLDIKTNGEENEPVYAAADGYICRIKMEKGGFGHALYILHPNGYTTLYAHLNKFVPEVQQYLTQQQYKQEKWDIDMQLTPQQFPVKKGQQIAWSGNTGGSTAPHLHFEIRDSKTEHPLNPELFGVPLKDNIAPLPHDLAIYDCRGSIYEDKPHMLPLKKTGKIYKPQIDTVITASGKTGIGLNIDDYMDSSTNTLAFYAASLYMDDLLQAEIKLDDIGYDVSRYVNAYADYKTKELQGKWVQLFFKLKGNELGSVYTHLNNLNGVLSLMSDETHKIRIEVRDAIGNISTVVFYLKYKEKESVITDPGCNLFSAKEASYFGRPDIRFSLDEKVLYDDICFVYKNIPSRYGYSDYHVLHYSYVPVHHSFELKINTNRPVPFGLRNKIVLMYTDGKDTSGRASYMEDDGWYKASVRNFGTYWLVADTTAPIIKNNIKNGADLGKTKQVIFKVKDALTSVKKYRGEIDGKWVCFEEHNDEFFYNFDEHCPPGNHELKFSATDENNNTSTIHFTFKR